MCSDAEFILMCTLTVKVKNCRYVIVSVSTALKFQSMVLNARKVHLIVK